VLTYVGVLSVITQGFLVGRLTNKFRDDILIAGCAALMAVSLAGWGMAPSVLALLIVLTPTAFAGGTLNTLLSSTLTKAVEPQEIGGILGLSASVESATRIFAPVMGGALLQHLGTWAPGAFGALLMVGVFAYVWIRIYNHPIIVTLMQAKPAPARVTTD
jgi:DHA1 family tetracycline resistance protein-like MFS transporter